MKDQDEMFEAATETPAFMGCPSLGPNEKVKDKGEGEQRNSTVHLKPSPSPESAAKLLACNERMRERIVEIAHLANECLLNTNHPNGYEPGQYGSDYRTYGKTIGQIRKTCKESMVEECVPDYEWLAKIMTREGFDPECLAKAIEAEASQRPIDYPTFYTPGWLCELAKKLEAQEPIREDSPDSPDSRSEAKAKQHDEFHRKHWTFCDGLFPIAFVVTQEGFMERCTINGRKFKASVVKEDEACEDSKHWNGYIYDNGKCVCMVVGMGKGKRCVMDMTHAAFKAYVKQLSGAGRKYRHHRCFLKQNAERARAAKQQAHDNKGAAATHS